MPTRIVAADKGIYPDSLTSCPAVLPNELLHPLSRAPAHKHDFNRLLEPRFIGHSKNKRRYSLITTIQIEE
jgi:hypothetical protein